MRTHGMKGRGRAASRNPWRLRTLDTLPGVVTLEALTFVIQNRQGDTVAMAVVSPQARYASTLSVRGGRIDRRFATPAEWRELEHHTSTGPAHVPTLALAFLTPGIEGSVLSVRWLCTLPLQIERPEDVAGSLDWHLQQQANELRLRLTLRQADVRLRPRLDRS